MNDEEKRLVSVTPEIKAHPLWDGSLFQQSFQWGGGVTRGQVRSYLKTLALCPDLTNNERSWIALWEKQL